MGVRRCGNVHAVHKQSCHRFSTDYASARCYNLQLQAARDGNETVFSVRFRYRVSLLCCRRCLRAAVSLSPIFILVPRSVYIPSSKHANKSKLTTAPIDKRALTGWEVNFPREGRLCCREKLFAVSARPQTQFDGILVHDPTT